MSVLLKDASSTRKFAKKRAGFDDKAALAKSSPFSPLSADNILPSTTTII